MQNKNKDRYINCCPVCGTEVNTQFNFPLHECFDCKSFRQTTKQERKAKDILNKRVPLEYISQYPKSHYEELSNEQYGDTSHWKEIFVAKELSKNPQFNKNEYLNSCERQKQRDEHKKFREEHPERFEHKLKSVVDNPQPHCPTCSSTNVHKISNIRRGVHAAMWGLLSTTAKCQ